MPLIFFKANTSEGSCELLHATKKQPSCLTVKCLHYYPLWKTVLFSTLSLITLRKLVSFGKTSFLVFSIIPSVVVFESVTCFLLQGVCKPLHCSYGETFPLSPLHTKRRVGTLHIGHDPDSSLQVAVNPMAIYLTSCIEKPVHFDLLQTFRKSMPCVAVWRGWREEENFLFVRGSVIFCGGSTVRWSYWSPSIQSVVHV